MARPGVQLMVRLLLNLLQLLGLFAVTVVILLLLTSLTGLPWLKKGIMHSALVLTAIAYSRMHRIPLRSGKLAWSGRARSLCLAGLAAGAATTVLVYSGLRLGGETLGAGSEPSAAWLCGTLAFYAFGAFGEEYFCRGFLLTLFAERSSWLVASVLSSACFAAFHCTNPEYYWFAFGYAFLLGLLLCLLVIRTGTLWFPIGFHLSFNFTQTVLRMPDQGGEILYLLSWILSVLLAFHVVPAVDLKKVRAVVS